MNIMTAYIHTYSIYILFPLYQYSTAVCKPLPHEWRYAGWASWW